MSDLTDRLEIKAGVIEMGEQIAWGSDTALMREAAEAIRNYRARVAELEEALASCQSWITDGGYEDDPDVARICDRARVALEER